MTEEQYKNREIDEKFREAFQRMQHFDKDARESLQRIEVKMDTEFKSIQEKQDYTNGKVKKIIMALIAITFLAIGMGINNGSFILSILGL